MLDEVLDELERRLAAIREWACALEDRKQEGDDDRTGT